MPISWLDVILIIIMLISGFLAMVRGFTREVRVDPDKSMLEIVATDQFGNTTKIRRSAKIASPMGSDTK